MSDLSLRVKLLARHRERGEWESVDSTPVDVGEAWVSVEEVPACSKNQSGRDHTCEADERADDAPDIRELERTD
jgi:hypothetical protein